MFLSEPKLILKFFERVFISTELMCHSISPRRVALENWCIRYWWLGTVRKNYCNNRVWDGAVTSWQYTFACGLNRVTAESLGKLCTEPHPLSDGVHERRPLLFQLPRKPINSFTKNYLDMSIQMPAIYSPKIRLTKLLTTRIIHQSNSRYQKETILMLLHTTLCKVNSHLKQDSCVYRTWPRHGSPLNLVSFR